jgi:hypothetical protein
MDRRAVVRVDHDPGETDLLTPARHRREAFAVLGGRQILRLRRGAEQGDIGAPRVSHHLVVTRKLGFRSLGSDLPTGLSSARAHGRPQDMRREILLLFARQGLVAAANTFAVGNPAGHLPHPKQGRAPPPGNRHSRLHCVVVPPNDTIRKASPWGSAHCPRPVQIAWFVLLPGN